AVLDAHDRRAHRTANPAQSHQQKQRVLRRRLRVDRRHKMIDVANAKGLRINFDSPASSGALIGTLFQCQSR
ncbi:hypothetical protein, partial [Variovorax boronicumulans]|uniref:hypothetical protein n=1 Tax=Variovorax boronicumulans TaxID=436515 RepID=UPI0027D89295